MDGSELGNRKTVGSDIAAVKLYGDRIANVHSPSLKKTHMDFSSKHSSRARELHKARRDIGQYKERGWTAGSAKVQAESELSDANKTLKDLSFMIEESSHKARAQMEGISRNGNNENSQVMRELENLKRELSQLKLDVATFLEEKLQVEKETEASTSYMLCCSRTTEVLRKEIEQVHEEQVLVELAKIDALRELRDIESQREKETNEFLSEMESKRSKLKEAIEEVDELKALEMKLAMTMSDVDVLQNKLKSAKEMEKKVQRDENTEDSQVLQAINEDLEAAKKELASIREEGFRLMASMDFVRNKLKHVSAESVALKKKESKADSKVQNLSSKILRAKSKLKALSAAEEKAKSIVISLSHTFDKLNTEIDAAKEEKVVIIQEVTTTEAETRKTEFEIDMTEERLQSAMQELEAIKSSEDLALEKLKILTENAMRDRGLATQQEGSLITISKFEYEYLSNRAAEAKEIADKKVAASTAWIEALKASEKEMLMKTEIAEREIKEMKLEEDYTKGKLVSKSVGRDQDLGNWVRKHEKNECRSLQRTMSKKSIKSNGSSTTTPSKGSKFQKSASPAARQVSPFTIKRKKKVLPNLTKLFRGKKNNNNVV